MSVSTSSKRLGGAGGTGDAASTPQEPLQRLARFYAYYAPERVESAPLTLDAYAGRVDLLFRALEKKYGPENRIPLIFSGATTDETVDASLSAAGTSPRHQQPASPIATKLDVLTSPPQLAQTFSTTIHLNHHQLRLERYYRYYASDKLSSVASTMEAYRGSEERLFRELEKKYGAEPRAFVVVTPRRTKPAETLNHGLRGSSPVAASPSSAAAADDDENSAFFVDPAVVGPSAGPDPKAIAVHTPYDYHGVLRQLGLREDAVDCELSAFGPSRLPYAASIAVIATLMGQEALFDVDPEKTPPFPFHALKEVKRTQPDSIDGLAYDHLLRYRTIFTTALQHVVYVRQTEMLERQRLLQQHQRDVRDLSRRMLVLVEAMAHIAPLEAEHRNTVVHEERIRYDGIVLWFRQQRLDLVSAGTTTTPRGEGGVLTSSRHVGILQLAEVEQQLRRVNDDIRAQSDALVAKWVQEPPRSTIRSILDLTPMLSSPSEGKRKANHSNKLVLADTTTTPSRGRFSTKTLHISSATGASGGAAAPVTSSPSRNRSPNRPFPGTLWVPSGPAATSHNAIAHRGTPLTRDGASVPAHPPAPVVVRENLHYDPFGRDDRDTLRTSPPVGFVTHDGLLLCAAPVRSPSATRRTASTSTNTALRSHSSNTGLIHHSEGATRSESHLLPYEIERNVRLKKVATKGSFSFMRHCAATEAKRFFASSD
jgi:hypothetical protein